jgi:hypothetical protein
LGLSLAALAPSYWCFQWEMAREAEPESLRISLCDGVYNFFLICATNRLYAARLWQALNPQGILGPGPWSEHVAKLGEVGYACGQRLAAVNFLGVALGLLSKI